MLALIFFWCVPIAWFCSKNPRPLHTIDLHTKQQNQHKMMSIWYGLQSTTEFRRAIRVWPLIMSGRNRRNVAQAVGFRLFISDHNHWAMTQCECLTTASLPVCGSLLSRCMRATFRVLSALGQCKRRAKTNQYIVYSNIAVATIAAAFITFVFRCRHSSMASVLAMSRTAINGYDTYMYTYLLNYD